MARFTRWLLIAIAVLVGVVIVLPFVLPGNIYKQQIIEATRVATGRVLAIDGDLSVSFWPTLGVVAEKVRFANTPGSSAPDMATMESLVVGAELFPLFSGTLKVTEIKLINPVINLEVDQQGRSNWQFEDGTGSSAAPRDGNSGGQVRFDNVQVTDGVLSYRNARSGLTQRVDAINAKIKLPTQDAPLNLVGDFVWNKEKVVLSTDVADPIALSKGGNSAATIRFESTLVSAAFAGNISAGLAKGAVEVRAKSARQLADWVSIALPSGNGFGALTFAGQLTATPTQVEFRKAKLALDRLSGTGEVQVALGKTRPTVMGRLVLDHLDLNAFSEANSLAAKTGPAPWSDQAMNFAPLKSVKLDLDISVGSLTTGSIKTGQSDLAITVEDGRLLATLKQVALYGGMGRGTMTLDGRTVEPKLALDLTLSSIQAESFLRDAVGLQSLTGTTDMTLRLLARGRSQSAWMHSLAGMSEVRFADGSIKGVNLAEISRTISSVLTGSAIGASTSTDFSELVGSFVIKDGVAANKDLKLTSPFVRLTGAGLIDLGYQTMNYRLTPKAVKSAEGQGGSHDVAGVGVPFRIDGPWSALTYQPDLSGTATTAIDAILHGKNPLDSLKGNGGFGEFFTPGPSKTRPPGGAEGATKSTQPAPNEPKKENPLDPLNNILGGGR